MSTKFVLKQFAANTDDAPSQTLEFAFEGGLFTIGTDASNTIVLSEGAPEQAVVIQEGSQLRLINRHAGTFLNDQSLRREAMQTIQAGDEIRIGNQIIQITDDETDFPINSPAENLLPIEAEQQTFAAVEKSPRLTSPEIHAPENPNSTAEKPTRNFADVLNALRTEEDKFYFTVKNGLADAETRIPIEQAEMPVGLNQSGQITCAVEQIHALYAIVRKDWSGIVIEAQRGGAVFVNDEQIKTVVRLRNGDRLSFNGARKSGKTAQSLELHEPTSLVALESILETRTRSEKPFNNFSQTTNVEEIADQIAPVPIIERKFFGHFSFFEIAAMIIGTLILAVLIFLGLEFTI